MVLYLYRAFLVLMTTLSSLQYSFTFTHSHTHSYSASISSTLLFYEGQFGVAQGHFGMQMGKTGDRTAYLQVGGQPFYPLSHSSQSFELSLCLGKSMTIVIWTTLLATLWMSSKGAVLKCMFIIIIIIIIVKLAFKHFYHGWTTCFSWFRTNWALGN